MKQLDLFEWADARRPAADVTVTSRDTHSAIVLDWCAPFAAKVMGRIHEYDDASPKRRYRNSVVTLPYHEKHAGATRRA